MGLQAKVNWILQGSIVLFGAVLVWFSFVFYPKITNDYKTGKILPKSSIFTPVVARHSSLPIETANYKIEYEGNSDTYYVFVNGDDLEEYVFNRDNAKLALKNVLSADGLCSYNVIYVSANKLKVPQKYQDNSDC